MTPEEHEAIVATGLHECAGDCPPRMITDRPATAGWDEANAVMPGAWRVSRVEDLMIAPPNNFVAQAVSIGRLKAGTRNAYGDSPESALDNLTRRLREMRDGADHDR